MWNSGLGSAWFMICGCEGLTAVAKAMIIECVPGSVVGIATGYGLDGQGIESQWGARFFRTCPDRPWGPPSLQYKGYRVFPGGKEGRGVTMTPHPLLVPLVMEEYSYTSTPAMGRTTCTEPQCLYKGDLYLYLTSAL